MRCIKHGKRRGSVQFPAETRLCRVSRLNGASPRLYTLIKTSAGETTRQRFARILPDACSTTPAESALRAGK